MESKPASLREDTAPVDPDVTTPATSAKTTWSVGEAVCLHRIPRYLKTADPMPMLRPPDLVGVDEVGTVVGQRALGLVAVRFRRGTFLIDSSELTAAADQG